MVRPAGSLPSGVDSAIYRDLVIALKARGCRVVLDASGEPLRLALEAKPHLFKPNIHELGELLGKSLSNEREVIETARHLIAGGIEEVVVSIGKDGACFVTANGDYPQDNSSIVPWQINVGASYTGLIPGRDQDKTLLGVIHGRFSDDYARTVAATGVGRPTLDTVVEIAHRIQLTKFPDIQFVSRPGGTGNIRDAVVIGAQMGITI